LARRASAATQGQVPLAADRAVAPAPAGSRGRRPITPTVAGGCTFWPGAAAAAAAGDNLPPPPAAVASDFLSPGTLLGLGFSFVAGLAIGYALKVAFKIALLAGGLLFILIFALQYGGLIEVNWAGVETGYEGLVGFVGAYGGALKGFMAENLPNAASFSAGLLLGLRL